MPRSELNGQSFALALAALSLGYALQISNAVFDRRALAVLLVGLTALAVCTVAPRRWRVRFTSDRPVLLLLAVGLAVQFGVLLTEEPAIYVPTTSEGAYGLFVLWTLVSAFLVGGLFLRTPLFGRAHFPLMLLAHMFLGFWLIGASPDPAIDVFVFHRDALNALLAGNSPYAITYPNIYNDTQYYGAELIRPDGRLGFGFPYPPLSLLLALPGHVLWGDYRVSLIFAMTATAALIAYANPSRLSMLAASVFLFSPRFLFVLEQGWTEPFAAALLAAAVFCTARYPPGFPYAVGLLVAVKQYLFIGAGALILLLPHPVDRQTIVRQLGIICAVCLGVTLPLALWTPSDFVHSVIVTPFYQPFRIDALSIPAAIVRAGGPTLPSAIGFLVAAVVLTVVLRYAPRNAAGALASFALVIGLFFAFNKQAFANYYFFVMTAACNALGSSGLAEPTKGPKG